MHYKVAAAIGTTPPHSALPRPLVIHAFIDLSAMSLWVYIFCSKFLYTATCYECYVSKFWRTCFVWVRILFWRIGFATELPMILTKKAVEWCHKMKYGGISKSFRTRRLERELQMV